MRKHKKESEGAKTEIAYLSLPIQELYIPIVKTPYPQQTTTARRVEKKPVLHGRFFWVRYFGACAKTVPIAWKA
jgi:hypothetical protein